MQKTEEDTILMDLFLACIFICHVNYIKVKQYGKEVSGKQYDKT